MSAEPRARPPRKPFRWLYLVIVLLILPAPFLLLRLADHPPAVRLEGGQWVRDTGEYAGGETCRGCHATIAEQHGASSHAQTVRSLAKERPRARFDTPQRVADPLTGAKYGVRMAGGSPEILVESGAGITSQRLDYEFGSGTHAFGYLAKTPDGTWIDARLNYYHKLNGWDFTSSQDKPERHLISQPLGRPQKPEALARCFTCHSTVVRADGAETPPFDGSQLKVRPDQSVLNVSCEACHGPRAQHVRERRGGAPVAAKAPRSADQINQICGRCHGLTNIDEAHPVIARFQPWGLAQSRCFRASQGKLSCLTCHDPHANARRDAAYYEGQCKSCHSKPAGQTACPVNPKSGCVSCHMPSDSKSMLHVTFVDHRIRIQPQEAKAR